MNHDATLVAPQGFGPVMGATSDAALAREWLGHAVVDAAVQELIAGPEGRTLAEVLETRGAINPIQASQLSLCPPVRLIGGFEVLRQLGAGAMGEVWLARRPGESQEVALKTMGSRYAANEEFIQRFERESDLIASLHHVHIAGAIARGVHQGAPWLAMEFIHGPTLQDLQHKHGALPELGVLRIALQVAKALGHAWSTATLVHRDIKPGNILLDTSGRSPDRRDEVLVAEDLVKIIDFGLAKSTAHEEGHQDMTMTGMVMGTPSYMSPEQIHGVKDLDHRADQYALGATIFHLLTHRVPYEGSSGAMVITGHLQSPIPDPGDLVPSLHAGTRSLVRTCLAKRREDRFQSWKVFEEAVEKVFEDLGANPPSTIKFLRKPMVLPNSLRKTPLPGSLVVEEPLVVPTPRPGSGTQTPPPTRPSGIVSTRPITGPVAKRTGAVHRTPLPCSSQSGEQALAKVMTDRVRRIRDVGDGGTPGGAVPLVVPPRVTPVDPAQSAAMRPLSRRLSAVRQDPAILRNLILLTLVAVGLVLVIVLSP